MKRRILSIVTALAMCLSLCPTWAFAVEDEQEQADISCGRELQAELDVANVPAPIEEPSEDAVAEFDESGNLIVNGVAYCKADVDLINKMIQDNGLALTPNDPVGWTESPYIVNSWSGSPKQITALNLYRQNLTGELEISGLANLTSVHCYSNQLTRLKLSDLPNLTYLSCYSNQLTSLELSNLPKLTNLNCSANQLTELNVSSFTGLTVLNCGNNLLQTLDVSALTALQELYCSTNQLNSLDVSSLTALKKLQCFENSLTSLNVSQNTALNHLHCNSNQLTSLTLPSEKSTLNYLACGGNQLVNLDVSNYTALKTLLCYENPQLSSLTLTGATSLETLWSYDDALTEVDTTGLNNLTSIRLSAGHLLSYTTPDGKKITVQPEPASGGTVGIAVPQTSNPKEVSLKASYSYANGYNFAYWEDLPSGTANKNSTVSLTVDSDITAKAVFKLRITAHMLGDGISPQIYSGLPIKPVSKITLNGDTFTLNEDFTCTYQNNINAGTAQVTAVATDTGRLAGSQDVTFKIIKAVPSLTAPTAELYYGQNLSDAALTGGSAVNPVNNGLAVDGTWAWTAPDTQPAGSGTYSSQFTPADTNNYEIPEAASAAVTVKPVTPRITITAPSQEIAGNSVDVSAVAANPYDPSFTDVPVVKLTYQIGDAGSQEMSGNSLTIPEDTEAGTIITITARTEEAAGKYSAGGQTASITVVQKVIPQGTPAATPGSITYGQPVSAAVLSGTMRDGDKVVQGTFAWDAPDVRPSAGSYTADWTFTPTGEDAALYDTAHGSLTITVNPASISGASVTLTPDAFAENGEAQQPSVSVSYGGAALIEGTDYTADISSGTEPGTYPVTITGKGNYAGTVTAAFKINAVATVEITQKDDEGHTLKLEVESGISEIPETFQDNEELNSPAKIEEKIKTVLTTTNTSIPAENTAVYDAELLVSTDGGTSWVKATSANFPTGGLTITLPYPEGTDSSYQFTVVHLFTTTDFGKKPGDTEAPAVTNTADGIQFTVTGLSPISVGWVKTTPTPPTTPTGPTGGGGSYVSTYAVTVEKSEHGKVTSSRTNASSGSTVTLTVTPDSGYVLDTLTVTDSQGNEIKLTGNGSGEYAFTMPGRAVTVKTTFAPIPDDVEQPCDGGENCPSRDFNDLGTVGTWYHEAVDYVLRNGLMGGYGGGLFGPDDNLSRAQFAQILYNKEGKPAVTGGSVFTDVTDGQWCAPAVTWAAAQGIVGGYGNGKFGPDDNITREQLAVMLWRYAGSPAATDKELHFTDSDQAGKWALEALRWAVEQGMINGKGNGVLDPAGKATRAEIAAMLMRYLEN